MFKGVDILEPIDSINNFLESFRGLKYADEKVYDG